MPQANESTMDERERCYGCLRPKSLCFCDTVPRIDNRTDILILQHVGERLHPFNTARIVHKALRRCRLIADHNRRFAARRLPIEPGAGLLYPRPGARLLSDLSESERPSQLVVIDGTWHQAKTIVRDVPWLAELPCYQLSPSSPGQYRIRREPSAESLSTLEATVSALGVLEPELVGLDRLLSVFHEMIETQLAHSTGCPRWRQRKAHSPHARLLPRVLLQNADRLVVAYGESTPGRPGATVTALPVNWFAQRLGTGERFCCHLRQPSPMAESALAHMRLSAAHFDDAVSREEFCRRWEQFLRPDDVLIVYHHKTHELLRRIKAAQPECLVLKSIFGQLRSDFHSLEQLMAIEQMANPARKNQARATERLEMAVALVERLRTHYSKLS